MSSIVKIVTWLRANIVVRVVLSPFMSLMGIIRQRRYVRSADSAFMKSLHNKHLGERCFIIGNGPSLRAEDLERLAARGEICFGSNRIYHIFSQTSWRPTYYISIDHNFLIGEINNIKASGPFPKLLNRSAAKFGRADKDNIWYVCMPWQVTVDYNKRKPPERLSDDPSRYISKMGTVTANAIEVAIYMGFKEIYLLGCDNNYAVKIGRDGKAQQDPSVKASYFAGMKDEKGRPGEAYAPQYVDFMTESYVTCRNYAEDRGVKIYNATRGGKLEVFERVDIDKVLEA